MCPVRAGDGHRTVQPLHGLLDERQADAAAERAGFLGAEAVPEDVVHGGRINARSRNPGR